MNILTEKVCFGVAFEALKLGKKIKLPEWGGWWFEQDKSVWVHLKTGEEVNQPWFAEFIFREDWIVFDDGQNG